MSFIYAHDDCYNNLLEEKENDPSTAVCESCGCEINICDLEEKYIYIDNCWYEVMDTNNYGYLHMVELDDGSEWYVAEDFDSAGNAAVKYYEDMIDDDPKEFICLVGEERLISWALHGKNRGETLDDWLELVHQNPEEMFGSYDGGYQEIEDGMYSQGLVDELGFSPGVAFRHN